MFKTSSTSDANHKSLLKHRTSALVVFIAEAGRTGFWTSEVSTNSVFEGRFSLTFISGFGAGTGGGGVGGVGLIDGA